MKERKLNLKPFKLNPIFNEKMIDFATAGFKSRIKRKRESTSFKADTTNMTEADGPDQVIYHIQKKQDSGSCEKQKDSSRL